MKIKEGVWYCVRDNNIQIVDKLILLEGVKPFHSIETDDNAFYYLDYDDEFIDSMVYIGEL